MPLDVCVLVAESPAQHGVDELLAAHQHVGHRAQVLHLSDVELSTGAFPRVQQGIGDIAHSRASALWGLRVQESLETVLPIVNDVTSQRAGRDKWVCAQRLAASKVPAIPTVLVTPQTTAAQLIGQLGDDVVIKPLANFGGAGVARRRGHHSIADALGDLARSHEVRVAQPYLEANAQDVRVLVIGETAIAAATRHAQSHDEFRSNVELGAQVSPFKLSADLEELAIDAARACGLEIAGVDILQPLATAPMVIEVNTNPGIGMWAELRESTGVDVAVEMARHIGDLAA